MSQASNQQASTYACLPVPMTCLRPANSRVVGGGELMRDIVFHPKFGEITAELGAPVTPNGRRSTERVDNDVDNGVRREGAQSLVQGVATPVVNADKKGLATKAEQIESHVLHGVSKMTGRGSGSHGIPWL